MDNRFCVYAHIRKDTNEIFYIGKGNKNRPNAKNSRNPHWHNIVNKCGYNVSILIKDLTDDESYNYEQWVISMLGYDNLTNLSSGGRGSYKRKVSLETRKKLSVANKRPNLKLRETLSNPIVKEKNRLKTIEAMNRPDVVLKRSIALKKALNKPDHIQKIKERLYKKVLDTHTNTIYNSVQEASKATGIKYSTLCSILNKSKKNKTTLIYLGKTNDSFTLGARN